MPNTPLPPVATDPADQPARFLSLCEELEVDPADLLWEAAKLDVVTGEEDDVTEPVVTDPRGPNGRTFTIPGFGTYEDFELGGRAVASIRARRRGPQ